MRRLAFAAGGGAGGGGFTMDFREANIGAGRFGTMNIALSSKPGLRRMNCTDESL